MNNHANNQNSMQNQKNNYSDLRIYALPEYLPNDILTFLSRQSFSGENNFTEVRALQQIIYYLSKPATKEQIESILLPHDSSKNESDG